MRTKQSTASKQLEALAGGPLTLGGLVRAIREGEEWSIREMAAKVGWTHNAIAAIEHGKQVSPLRAATLAKALGYAEEDFVRLALQDELERAGLRYEIRLAVG